MMFEALTLRDRIGTEIRTDVATLLTPAIARKVRHILRERGVVVFKKINLSDEEQVAFAALLGTVRDEGQKGVFKITLDEKENPGGAYLKGSFLWHMDGTHDDIPVFASLLSGRKLSDVGGQTEFANSYQAHDELSEELKDRIKDLKVVHSVAYSFSRAGIAGHEEPRIGDPDPTAKTHNLVWTHETGRKSLVIGCHASHVVGMDIGEGRALLKELVDWTTQPRFVYRHEWDVGDLLIWDNTGVLHRAEPYPMESGRMMHRTTLMGEEAFA